MNAGTVKWLVAGAFALHGIGMAGAAAYLPFSMRSAKAAFVGSSWLLGAGVLAIAVGVVVWLLSGAGFIAAAAGFWQGATWWRAAAWVGAVLTLVATTLWFRSVPSGVYAGAALALGTVAYLAVA